MLLHTDKEIEQSLATKSTLGWGWVKTINGEKAKEQQDCVPKNLIRADLLLLLPMITNNNYNWLMKMRILSSS